MSIINNQGLSETQEDKETARLIKEYLENGGKITVCKADATTPNTEQSYGWGKRKPQAKPKE
jgi:predicted peroxiredoxin